MSNKEVKIVIKAVDEFSKAFNDLDDKISKVGKAAGSLGDSINQFGDISGVRAIGKLGKELAIVAIGMQSVAGRAALAVRGVTKLTSAYIKLYDASKKNFFEGLEKLGSVFGGILGGLGKVGGGFLNIVQQVTGADLSFGGLVQSSTKFEENLKRVVNMNGAIKDDAEKSAKVYHSLTEAAQKWAIGSQYSPEEIASGMMQMTQAGLEYKEVLNSIGAVTALSTAGNLDFARSSEILINTMNAFQEDVFSEKRTMDYANVLTGVANSSATSVDQIGNAMVNFAASAGLMGYSIEDVGIGIGLMGNQFIKSGRAGTAMKNIINRVTGANSTAKKAIDKYNLEAFEQEMQNGNLVSAFKELIKATEKYDKTTKNKIATDIAGSYGAQGLLTIMGSTVEELEEMEVAIKKNGDAWGIHHGLMESTYGKFLQLSSIVQVLGTELMDVFGPALNKGLQGLVDFGKSLFHIEGEGENVEVRLKSLSELASNSKNWGRGIETGIQNAINGLKKFVSGGNLDNILTIGTNIIQGICRGISNNKATLQETFSTAIQKACNFIKNNSEAIGQAGRDILDALANAIRDNETLIKSALDDLMGIITEWAKGDANLTSAMGLFADSMMNAFVEQAIVKATGRGGEILNAFWSGVTISGPNGQPITEKNQGPGLFDPISQKLGNKSLAKDDAAFGDWMRKNVGAPIYKFFTGKEMQLAAEEGGQKIGKTTSENIKVAFDENGMPIVQSATDTGTQAAEGIQAALQGMDLNYLQSLGAEMTTLGINTTSLAQSMTASFDAIAQGVQTSMTSLSTSVGTAMTEARTAVYDQAVSMALILQSQTANMSSAIRDNFLAVRNIVHSQMLNARNVVYNQALSMSKIMDNQAKNISRAMEDCFDNLGTTVNSGMDSSVSAVETGAERMTGALESGMSGMADAASSAMAKVVSAVEEGMAQAQSIASAPITINITSNISRKVTTTHVAGGLMQTMGSISRNSIAVSRPSVMAGGGGASITRIPTQEKAYAFTIPVVVDGREVARATAKYSQAELDRLNKRNSRKRGE